MLYLYMDTDIGRALQAMKVEDIETQILESKKTFTEIV